MSPVSSHTRPSPEIIVDVMSCLGSNGFPNSSASSLPLTIPTRQTPPVDSFLNGLLQAVNVSDVPIRSCTSCEEGIAAASQCRDCSEMLCDPCVRAHQRVRITKDHRIVRFAGEANEPPIVTSNSLGSSQASNSPCSSSGLGASGSYCDSSHEARLYCESCLTAVCTECTLIDHTSHQLVYIQDAIDGAKGNTMKLSAETRSGITAVREAIDNIQRLTEAVEIRTHQAAADVRNVIKRYVVVLEERERELLAHIEQFRQAKGKALQSHMDTLRLALTKLARLSDLLADSLDASTGLDALSVNEKATTELRQIRSIKLELGRDEGIAFVPPDVAVLRAVANMGGLSYTGGSALAQSRTKELQVMPLSERKAAEPEQFGSGSLRGRPIPNAARPIVVRKNDKNIIAIGSEGEGDGNLCRPWGVCCDRTGNIIVADRSNNRIQVFRPNGAFSHKFGGQGTGPCQFDRPAGVAVDPSGRIVIADKDNHRIQILTIEGSFVLMFGEKGCRNSQFNYPWDVAVNCQGHIVVSDTRNHRIQIFSNEGAFMNKYGFEGTSPMWKHFDSPRGVCFTPTGSIIVTDFNNHRIVIIDHRFAQAQFLGSEGSCLKQFQRPQGIVCDDEGRIIVADSRNHRIQVFEANGTYLWMVGKEGRGIGELDRPSGICLNPEGRIVVVDFGNNRVQLF